MPVSHILRPILVAATTTLVAAATAWSSPTSAHFRSPSGNINCTVFTDPSGDEADCLVLHNTWRTHPARPASCKLDWNRNEVGLFGTHAHVGACRGDIGPLCANGNDRCTTLAYGRSVTIGSIRCTMTTAGVSCRRRSGRHQGFLVSRQRYTLYR
jgi:hypothetical protein